MQDHQTSGNPGERHELLEELAAAPDHAVEQFKQFFAKHYADENRDQAEAETAAAEADERQARAYAEAGDFESATHCQERANARRRASIDRYKRAIGWRHFGLRSSLHRPQRVKTPQRRQTFCPARLHVAPVRGRSRESAPKPSAKRTASRPGDEGPGEPPPDGPSDDGRGWSL